MNLLFCFLFSWLLPHFPFPRPNLFLCYKLPPQCLKFEFLKMQMFDADANVLSVEASFMCIEARELGLTFKCWTYWLALVASSDSEGISSTFCLCLLQDPYFWQLSWCIFKRGSHENIQDWVEAAVEECNTLCDLDGNIHAFAHVTVSDQGVDDVYGLAELDNVIR